MQSGVPRAVSPLHRSNQLLDAGWIGMGAAKADVRLLNPPHTPPRYPSPGNLPQSGQLGQRRASNRNVPKHPPHKIAIVIYRAGELDRCMHRVTGCMLAGHHPTRLPRADLGYLLAANCLSRRWVMTRASVSQTPELSHGIRGRISAARFQQEGKEVKL